MKFKERLATNYIYVVLKNLDNKSAHQLFVEARRKGEFDTGYHLILHNDGNIENDRNIDCVAQWNFENADCSIYILADVYNGRLSDAQRIRVREISSLHPNAEVRKVVKE